MAKKIKNAPAADATAGVTGADLATNDAANVTGTATDQPSVAQPNTALAAVAAAPAPKAPAAAPAPEEYKETDQSIAAGHNSSNALVQDMSKLLTAVGKLGRDNGQGKKSMVALAERVMEAAIHGIVGSDDAEKIYTKFRKESANASGFLKAAEQGNDSMQAQVSKLRRFIEMGKGLPDDAVAIIEMARDMHVQALSNDDKKYLRSKGTYDALVSVARAQLADERKGIPLDEEAVRAILLVDEADKHDTTGLDMLKTALRNIENAIAGKKASTTKPERAPIQHDNVTEAALHIRQALYELDPVWAKEQDEAAAAAAKEEEEKAAKAAAAEQAKVKVAAFMATYRH